MNNNRPFDRLENLFKFLNSKRKEKKKKKGGETGELILREDGRKPDEEGKCA